MTANDHETVTIQDRRSLDDRAPRRLPSDGDRPPTATERDTTMKHSERLLTITEVGERLNVPLAPCAGDATSACHLTPSKSAATCVTRKPRSTRALRPCSR